MQLPLPQEQEKLSDFDQMFEESIEEVIRDLNKENLDNIPPRYDDNYIKDIKKDVTVKFRQKLEEYQKEKATTFTREKIDSLVNEVADEDNKELFRKIRDYRILGKKKEAGVEGLVLDNQTIPKLDPKELQDIDYLQGVAESLSKKIEDEIAHQVVRELPTKVDKIDEELIVSGALRRKIIHDYSKLAEDLESSYTEELRQIKLMNLYQEFAQHHKNKKLINNLSLEKQKKLEEAFYKTLKPLSEKVSQIHFYLNQKSLAEEEQVKVPVSQ